MTTQCGYPSTYYRYLHRVRPPHCMRRVDATCDTFDNRCFVSDPDVLLSKTCVAMKFVHDDDDENLALCYETPQWTNIDFCACSADRTIKWIAAL